MELPKLYGTDSRGGIKEWSVAVDNDEVVVRHGKLGGKIQEKRTKVKGKNIGRSNETTPHEQALKDAKSKWNRQKDKSYCEDKDNIKPLLNPMLAHDYHKQGHRIKFPCGVQPKLDGVRCLAYLEDGEIVFKSRGGKNYKVPPHIGSILEHLFNDNAQMVLDGELYKHGMPLNRISSATKKPNEDTDKLEFWVFDLADVSLSWKHRQYDLEGLAMMWGDFEGLNFVKPLLCSKEGNLQVLHDHYVGEGYEGVMLRNFDGMYKYDHRSADLQKLKMFKDDEYEIVGLYESSDGLGMFTCIAPDSTDSNDKTFGVTPAWTHQERAEMLDHPDDYVGKMLTVKYQAMTKFNKPQFGTGVNVRADGE